LEENDSEEELYPRKRVSETDRDAKQPKIQKLSDEDRIKGLESLLTKQQEIFKSLQTEMTTHTEAIQGLMQVVSTPQNLANFQQQYAYSQMNSQMGDKTAQPAQPTPAQPQVQYMPVFAYPPQMYYQQVQQPVPVIATPVPATHPAAAGKPDEAAKANDSNPEVKPDDAPQTK